MPLADIADWSGHSNVSITKQFYAEMTLIMMARTADQIAAIFGEYRPTVCSGRLLGRRAIRKEPQECYSTRS